MVRKNCTKKTQIEVYRNYKIYIISGYKSHFFIAEKEDPSKGSTLVNDSLEDLRKDIDTLLGFASKVKISTYEGPEQSYIIQKVEGHTAIQFGCKQDDIVVVLTPVYDIDDVINKIDSKQTMRKSKKHRKNNSGVANAILLRLLYRDNTYQ